MVLVGCECDVCCEDWVACGVDCDSSPLFLWRRLLSLFMVAVVVSGYFVRC